MASNLNTDAIMHDTMLYEPLPSAQGPTQEEREAEDQLFNRMRLLQIYARETRSLRDRANQGYIANLDEELEVTLQTLLSHDDLDAGQWAELSTALFGDQQPHVVYRLPTDREQRWHLELDAVEAGEGIPNSSGRTALRQIRVPSTNVPRSRQSRPRRRLRAAPPRGREPAAQLRPETTATQLLAQLPDTARGLIGYVRRDLEQAGRRGQTLNHMREGTRLGFAVLERNRENLNMRTGDLEPGAQVALFDDFLRAADRDRDTYGQGVDGGQMGSENEARHRLRDARTAAPVLPALLRL
ncbi:hypothetical protein RB595_008678 [Gaeumannomyces hyphopodioides]